MEGKWVCSWNSGPSDQWDQWSLKFRNNTIEMEGEVCRFNKFGFCKYRKDRKKIHYIQDCKDLEDCKNVQNCQQRHPKVCKKFAAGKCRFGDDCDYSHQKTIKRNEQQKHNEKMDVLENKVDVMALKIHALETELFHIKQNKNNNTKEKENPNEKVLKALSRKVLELEGEIKRIKFNSVKNERSEGKGVSDQVKKKQIELGKVGSKQNFMDNEISFDHNDVKNSTSTPKKKKEIVLESEAKEEFLSCNKCNYKCKKGTILRKHMITKHEEHPCKECDMKLKTFMDLLQHFG